VARPGAARGALHVGRYFAVLLGILVLLYSIVFLAGPKNTPLTPKLGLDLQGGASVILQPKTTPKQSQLDTAVEIINRRVNGLGVAEAEVVTQGNNIVVSVPGGSRESIRSLATTAQLRFREVLEALPGSPTAATPSGAPTAPSVTTTIAPQPSKGASAAPKPSATANGRALSGALLAATPSPTPQAPTPKPSTTATPTPSASASAQDGVRTGDRYTPQAFAALDCSKEENRRGGANDSPDEEIIACSADGSEKYHLAKAEVVGTDVKGATAERAQLTGEWQIIVSFTGKGQDKFTELTQKTIQKRVAIVLDGVALSAPTIQDRIDSDAQITGSFTRKSASDLANTLKYGALPLSFEPGQVEVVSPTLGKDQLHAGLLAGGIGLIAVVIYSLLYYRALGVVTVLSLVTSGLLVYAATAILGKQIGFALSLAGIAGFIVAVGITADSFVVFFERLKDEIKEGRTPRSAVDRAWVRARRTILSADTVSFLAAIILYFVSVGGVRGFAFTLGLSTLLDVVVVFLFTRPLVSWLSRYRWFSDHRYTGFHGPNVTSDSPSPSGSARRGAPVSTSQPTLEA
jgi:preprotein translocase subunit SecD